MTDLETYAEQTAASLLYLQLEAMGLSHVTTDHCASHYGKAVGIMTALRAFPFRLREKQFCLPMDIFSQVGGPALICLMIAYRWSE